MVKSYSSSGEHLYLLRQEDTLLRLRLDKWTCAPCYICVFCCHSNTCAVEAALIYSLHITFVLQTQSFSVRPQRGSIHRHLGPSTRCHLYGQAGRRSTLSQGTQAGRQRISEFSTSTKKRKILLSSFKNEKNVQKKQRKDKKTR